MVQWFWQMIEVPPMQSAWVQFLMLAGKKGSWTVQLLLWFNYVYNVLENVSLTHYQNV